MFKKLMILPVIALCMGLALQSQPAEAVSTSGGATCTITCGATLGPKGQAGCTVTVCPPQSEGETGSLGLLEDLTGDTAAVAIDADKPDTRQCRVKKKGGGPAASCDLADDIIDDMGDIGIDPSACQGTIGIPNNPQPHPGCNADGTAVGSTGTR